MTARSFREPGQPAPAAPPLFPRLPVANRPPRRPGPRSTARLALLAMIAEDEAKEGGSENPAHR
jgi:hypothetical protein